MSIAIVVRPVSVEQILEHSPSTIFLCCPTTYYRHTQSFHKMRFTSLTVLFFALFVLFSSGFLTSNLHGRCPSLTLFALAAMAYAAPVAPQGATVKRQCSMVDCRDAVSASVGGGVSTREWLSD